MWCKIHTLVSIFLYFHFTDDMRFPVLPFYRWVFWRPVYAFSCPLLILQLSFNRQTFGVFPNEIITYFGGGKNPNPATILDFNTKTDLALRRLFIEERKIKEPFKCRSCM